MNVTCAWRVGGRAAAAAAAAASAAAASTTTTASAAAALSGERRMVRGQMGVDAGRLSGCSSARTGVEATKFEGVDPRLQRQFCKRSL